MTTLQSAADALFGRSPARPGPSWLVRAIATAQCWVQRVRSRDALAELDEHMLKDVGLTRADIVVEQGKYFWQR